MKGKVFLAIDTSSSLRADKKRDNAPRLSEERERAREKRRITIARSAARAAIYGDDAPMVVGNGNGGVARLLVLGRLAVRRCNFSFGPIPFPR